MKIRTLLTGWHRWFGLLGGLWLFLLAATGAVIVFYDEIDRALNPDLWNVPPRGEAVPVAEAIAAAESVRAGTYARLVDLPDLPTEPVVAYLAPRQDAERAVPAGLHVFVDPYTGEVLGERVFGAFRLDRRHFAHFLYQLHMDLHLGPTARWLVGLLGFLWLVDHLVAATLSFPKPRRWLESFRVRRGARGYSLLYGLHRAGGLWWVPVTLAIALSGLYFNWHETFRGTVDAISPVSERYETTVPTLAEPIHRPAVSADRAVAIAREHAGGAAVDGLALLPDRGLFWVRLFDPRDLDAYGGRWIYVDMTSGRVRADRHATGETAGDAILAWQFPLHSGKAFGWPGRIAVFLTGLAVCGFVLTGYLIWWRKRSVRRSAVRRRRTAPGAGARPDTDARPNADLPPSTAASTQTRNGQRLSDPPSRPAHAGPPNP